MPDELEPTAGDILASKVGMHTVMGKQFALQMLFTGLLETLRVKGLLAENEIQTIIEAASATLSESFDDNARDNPSAAEYIDEIKTAAEDLITWTRNELAKTSD